MLPRSKPAASKRRTMSISRRGLCVRRHVRLAAAQHRRIGRGGQPSDDGRFNLAKSA